jgi:hypothetical protein
MRRQIARESLGIMIRGPRSHGDSIRAQFV